MNSIMNPSTGVYSSKWKDISYAEKETMAKAIWSALSCKLNPKVEWVLAMWNLLPIDRPMYKISQRHKEMA